MNYNQNSGYGAALLQSITQAVPTFGRVFALFNSSDVGNECYNRLQQVMLPDPAGKIRFYTSIETLNTDLESNNDDVVLLDAHTSHKVAAMLTISKSRIHFIGLEGGGRQENQRALISNTGAGAATDTAMVKITGTGCTFRNISFKNNWTVTENVYCVDDQSSNALFVNCTIHNLGSAHLTNAAAADLRLSSNGTEYHNCSIGADTLKVTSTAGQKILIAKATTAATRVLFKDCNMRTYTSDTTHSFVRVSADGDIDRFVTFDNPRLENFNTGSQGATMAVAMVTPNGLVSGGIHVINPSMVLVTKLATDAVGNDNIYVSANVNPTAASAGAVLATA